MVFVNLMQKFKCPLTVIVRTFPLITLWCENMLCCILLL